MNGPGPAASTSPRLPPLAAVLLAGFVTPSLVAQTQVAQAPAKTDLSTDDYARWESIGTATLAPDGAWVAYQVRRNDGDSTLHLRPVKRQAKGSKSGNQEFDYGAGQVFSNDSRFLAFRIGMAEKAREKLTKAKQAVRNKLGLHDLRSGKTATFDDVKSFRFRDDGKFLLLRRYKPKDSKTGGADLLVRNLASGQHTTFGKVKSYAWMQHGPLLAMVFATADKLGNGVGVYDPNSGRLQTLDSAQVSYSSLVWRKDAADLAVLRDRDHEDDEDASFVVLTWRHLDSRKPVARRYDHLLDGSFPKDRRVVDFASLRWSDDGETVFFGIKAWEHKPSELAKAKPKAKKKSSKDDEPAGVEIWHARDIEIQPHQKKIASKQKNRSELGAFWLRSGNFVRIGNAISERASLVNQQKHALGFDNTPYETLKRFGPTLTDVYLIDVRTGARQRILKRLKYQLGTSPDGRYLVYLKGQHLWTYDIAQATHRNLTRSVTTKFTNQEMSSLTDEKPAYGIAGWSESGDAMFVYSRYDMWMFRPDGKGIRRLTRGAERRIRYRRLILDAEADEFVDLDAPIYYSVYGDLTKKSGFAVATKDTPLRNLVFADKRLSRLAKARNTATLAYIEEGFDDSPDVFVTAPGSDQKRRQISTTNSFQKDYHWGRAELIRYQNAHGQELQGALHYPAKYVAGKQYPMIVYIYELRSQNLHRYSAPSERRPYNPGVFTTQGYFVFQPDIVYRPQNPGLSAVECVVPAVEAVLARGHVDRKRVGLVGHSWGAYQTAFIVTQTDLFAAGVAGAPLTNMMSMSMSIYWNSGRTDAWIFHESQGRMDRPFWQDVDTYIKNSPIFNIDQLNTPLLIAFGDKDGAVDWHQGIEMYNAARLAQKPLVMLVYAGENHGLRQKPNQIDYHHRVRHWFDHHLKGVAAKPWVTQGKTHLDREKELDAHKRAKKKRGKASKAKK